MARQIYNQTGTLSRFILRRDRIRIPVWLLSICAVTLAVAHAFTDLYSSKQERQTIAETMKNPAMTAMVGKGYGLENYTSGAMMAHQMLLFTALTVGLMSILLVARHTRADEEDGRIELIRSLPTGRLSNLNSTIIVVCGTNVLLALVTGFGLYALGIESMDLEGSLLYGAALGATGILFTAITAIFAQLSENSRGTIGLSFAVLGLSYLVRAIGDAGNETLSWFSPLGWVLGAEVYVNNYWWPILLTIGVSLIFILLAFYLNAIRDLGSGFLRSRPGRKYASVFLQSRLGLTLRLQRTGLIAWSIGLFLLGASYGSVFGDLDSFFENIDILTPVEGFSLTEQFITMLMSIMAMLSTIPALMAMLKLIGEEKKNRTEHLLSRAVSRTQLMGSSFLVSFVVAFVMPSLAAIGLWSAASAVMDDGIAFGTLYGAAMVYLPAIWIMIGIAVLVAGVAPKLTGLIWLYLTYSFVVVYLGGLLQFPKWLGKLSPFGQIPKLPVEDMDFPKAFMLTIIAIVITVIGFIGYNKRDIEG
ncbi:ABC transporter permease [Lederbergia citrea]|uniref:ABC transporter permease n=1 Tax=Lederbergia citrea TaxID=2833581 RepID=A0A942UNH8_9BACI|nr:ABC transporter permease [Lederbergia citrea]MBS4179065.1 ABC transporter permease [Lederbergia citrea]MBS4223940.1 ABC transporter permease [Lederbergia citrea]